MICQMVLMAGAMTSPQATYYAETCYVKSITYPMISENCAAELPDRAAEFAAAVAAWQQRHAAAIELSKAHLESIDYDFESGMIPMGKNMARNWLNEEKTQGRAAVEGLCDAHLSDLKS